MAGDRRLEGRLLKKAEQLLPRVADLLRDSGIDFCLESGTLLGIYREGRLLPWDNDIDLFARAEDAERIYALRWKLLMMGCWIKIRPSKKAYGPIPEGAPRSMKIGYIPKINGDRVHIDIFLKYCDGVDYHWVIGCKNQVHKKISRKYYDQFDEIEFKGKTYPIPAHVEEYLTARYGDWRVPVKDYSWVKDDSAIVSGEGGRT